MTKNKAQEIIDRVMRTRRVYDAMVARESESWRKILFALERFEARGGGASQHTSGLYGVPVVATTLAAEGMELADHEDVLLADEPEDFARALIELYESEELWNRLSENGIRKMRELYSTHAARQKLEFLFSDDHLADLVASRKG
jgi:glycosyltransferase involved in cell wall biosynthesis